MSGQLSYALYNIPFSEARNAASRALQILFSE